MGNPCFQFKQFTVYHDRCAMKVGIDGVLLGVWANVCRSKRILDIGTGSGLIALILAQRSDARIDAIDLDSGAIDQAGFNVQQSPWADRIGVYASSLQEYSADQPYDLIVSNPPYFVQSLQNPDQGRTMARHTQSLSHEELLDCSVGLLTAEGRVCVILPVTEGERLLDYAGQTGWFCARRVHVYPMPHLPAKRLLLEFVRTEVATVSSDLIIELERHRYSDDFTAMAKDFYLKL